MLSNKLRKYETKKALRSHAVELPNVTISAALIVLIVNVNNKNNKDFQRPQLGEIAVNKLFTVISHMNKNNNRIR